MSVVQTRLGGLLGLQESDMSLDPVRRAVLPSGGLWALSSP